ncbi:MAG: TIGR00270 family protein [Candidatus Bathyarchaeota archaeon]|nr:MAG: TIGR00270 family protein [Candidatus Bathyarchaeota archaeon]
MSCEVCGSRIRGKPNRTIIEGAKLTVCNRCAKLGSIFWEAKSEPRLKKVAKRLPQPMLAARKKPVKLQETLELVEDFSFRVRQAREKLGLSQEDLGRKLNEKVSLLRKIESGKMAPDHRLAEKLGRALKIKLLVPFSEPKVSSKALSHPPEVTLGDLINVRKGKTEAPRERKQS